MKSCFTLKYATQDTWSFNECYAVSEKECNKILVIKILSIVYCFNIFEYFVPHGFQNKLM